MEQLRLFEEPVTVEILMKKIDRLQSQQDNLRRGLFQRMEEINKIVKAMEEEREIEKMMESFYDKSTILVAK